MIEFVPNYHFFNDKTVRELVWAVASPPLLNTEICLPYHWFQEHYLNDLDFFQQLDQSPKELHEYIRKKNPKRLGKYFETLLEFWFLRSPQFKLHASNLQVRDGKRTIGEIDFIVEDRKVDQVFHFEVAVKFYLQHESGKDFMQWIGPNTRDRLAFKYQKLIEHQLAILGKPSGECIAEELRLKNIQSKGILKGFFFYPFSENRILPKNFHPLHLRGRRIHFLDFVESGFNLYFLSVEKKDWFSVPHSVSIQNMMDYHSARKFVLERMAVLPNSFMLIAFDQEGQETERFMVVPDSWPEFAF